MDGSAGGIPLAVGVAWRPSATAQLGQRKLRGRVAPARPSAKGLAPDRGDQVPVEEKRQEHLRGDPVASSDERELSDR